MVIFLPTLPFITPLAGSPVAVIAAQDRPTAKTVFDNFENAGFTLSKTVYGGTAASPATFQYVHDYLGKVTWGVSAALVYDPREAPSQSAFGVNSGFIASAETAVSQSPSTGENAFRFRAGEFYNLRGKGDYGVGRFQVNALWETDQPWENENGFVEFAFRPLYPRAGLSATHNIGGISYELVPVTILAPGYAFKTASPGSQRNVSRAVEDATLNIGLPKLASSLGFSSVQLTAEDKFFYLPYIGGLKARNEFNPSLIFAFTKNASLTFSYDIGDDSPLFQKVDKFTIALGLTFGSSK